LRRAAEWEPQESVWLCYPSNKKHWGENLEKIRLFCINLIKLISKYQKVELLLNDETDLDKLKAQLQGYEYEVHFHFIPHNDIWIRDFGPIFVNNEEEIKIIKFGFNAWGGKFPPYELDNKVPYEIAKILKCEIEEVPLVLEGGALEFNGDQLLLSTKSCLLGKTRNPNKTERSIKSKLLKSMSLSEIYLFEGGLLGDHTDGHVDNIIRFIDGNTLMIASADEGDAQYEFCQCLNSEVKVLQSRLKDLNVVHLDLPKSLSLNGEILSRSYLNFIFLNGAIVVPTFNESSDQKALNQFKVLFPDHDIHGYDCRDLVVEGGGLHCMTCHQPKLEA